MFYLLLIIYTDTTQNQICEEDLKNTFPIEFSDPFMFIFRVTPHKIIEAIQLKDFVKKNGQNQTQKKSLCSFLFFEKQERKIVINQRNKKWRRIVRD